MHQKVAIESADARQTVTRLEQGTVKLKYNVRSDYTNVRAPAGVTR